MERDVGCWYVVLADARLDVWTDVIKSEFHVLARSWYFGVDEKREERKGEEKYHIAAGRPNVMCGEVQEVRAADLNQRCIDEAQ